MEDHQVTLQQLKEKAQQMVREREWEQFHNAKNLSMKVAIEASELMELFLWIDGKDCDTVLKEHRQEVEFEIADVAIALLCLCNRYNIDLADVITRKLEIINQRYPVEKSKGKSTKYTKLV